MQHTRRQISDNEILVEWADKFKIRMFAAFSVKNRLCLSSMMLFLEVPTVRSNVLRFCILRVSRDIATLCRKYGTDENSCEMFGSLGFECLYCGFYSTIRYGGMTQKTAT